jgi:hypothetical protein
VTCGTLPPRILPHSVVSPLFLPLYLRAGSARPLNSSQVSVTAITEATGSCTLEASPLLQINGTTTSTVHKLFIYSEAKYCNFLRKQGLIWPFNILKFYVPKWRSGNFRETWGVQHNHIWLRLIQKAKSHKTCVLQDLNWRHPSQTRSHLQLADFNYPKSLCNQHKPIKFTRSRTRIPTCGSDYILQFRLQLRPSEDTLWQLRMSTKQSSHLRKTTDLPPVVTLSPSGYSNWM